VQRTWVKTVEHGAYQDEKRSFQVTRCNHCANPPCVRICPTGAMYQRDDGIVEFDRDSCIGCKSCIQACPYDAIYIDPQSGTAAKCHYCSHRTDVGLEPACVVVCPVHAIIAGDLDDPNTEIAKTVAGNKAVVRKPEQGTAPKLLYIDGEDIALHPTMFDPAPVNMATVDIVDERGASQAHHPHKAKTRTARSGVATRVPSEQGVPTGGPIRVGQGKFAEHMTQVAYNAQHKVYWHWPVPAYLVTKGIGAGVFLFLALGAVLGMFPVTPLALTLGGAVGIAGLLATTALLVYDLEKPLRFLYILLYPQWKSWLVRGAFLLIGLSTVATLAWAAGFLAWVGWFTVPAAAMKAMYWITWPLAIGAAIYTAFLFAQAEGRDLWQSPLLPFHLVIQALMLGSGTFVVLGLAADFGPLEAVARWVFGATLVVDLFVTLVGEFTVPHASEVAAKAAHEITKGRYKNQFWIGSVGLGHVVPLALLGAGVAALGGIAVIAAAIGLYFYEHAFVMAPQEVPNS